MARSIQTSLAATAALWLTLLLAGCGGDTEDAAPPATQATPDETLTTEELAAEPRLGPELEWDDLIPADWRPDKLFADFDIDNLDDDDPRADELMQKLEALWSEAPVVEALDGQTVRLPGFVVPLTTDATEIREFLLVPYFGACIHVPPPPANQTVYVVTSANGAYRGELFDTVWVEGVMHIERFSNDLGEAGYRIDAVRVSPYEEES
jgi:uncharacterized protein